MTEAAAAADGQLPDLGEILRSRGYHALLLLAGLVGVPVAVVAFTFLAVANEMENWVWVTVPKNLGWDQPTAWYAVAILAIAGVLVGLVIAGLPGRGGHIAANGLGGGAPVPKELTGVVLAALASLILGAVLGPEAPLTALGGGLILLFASRSKLAEQPQALQVLTVAGSAAAIATIFGNPVVAAVLMLEVVGLAGRQVLLVLLPCLVSTGVSGLLFTGLDSWTGIDLPALTVPGLPSASIDGADLLWVVPVAILAAVGAQLTRRLGLMTAEAARHRTVVTTQVAGVFVGACAAVYTLLTDRSPTDVLQSGEAALPALVGSPTSWAISTLLLLLLLKGLAYGISLGSFRGGPTFPAVYLGAVIGILVAPLPGLGVTAGIAIAMTAATTAALRLPLTSVVLVVLLLGAEATSQIPIIMVSAVVAMVAASALDDRTPAFRRVRRSQAQAT